MMEVTRNPDAVLHAMGDAGFEVEGNTFRYGDQFFLHLCDDDICFMGIAADKKGVGLQLTRGDLQAMSDRIQDLLKMDWPPA